MRETVNHRPNRVRDFLGLIGFLVLCLAVSVIGGATTATSVDSWYQTLQKPPFNPPDWVFAPVWSTLYILMAIAGWRIWRLRQLRAARIALTVFALQLALNLAWSFIFFGFQMIGLALAEVLLLLWALIVSTVLFWRIDRVAGMLFAPYLAWVAYAAVLNGALWLLN